MKNQEAIKIRSAGRNILITAIILCVLNILFGLFDNKWSISIGFEILGFGVLVYFFSRGFSEVIELLHHIAMGIGTVDPETNLARPVTQGNAMLDLFWKRIRQQNS